MLIKATEADFDRIKQVYIDVIDSTPDMKKYVKWEYGKHPNDEMIKRYIEDGNMYIFMDERNIAGLVAITFFQEEEYRLVEWQIGAKDNEIMVLHLLCTATNYQGKGIAKKIIHTALNLAKEKNMKACRLDALNTNIPAHNLYEGEGFIKCGTQHWYAENTGWIDFYLYEYVLEEQ